MTGGAAAERWNAAERPERSLLIVRVGHPAQLIERAAAAGVRLEARPGGLWADRPNLLPPDLRTGLVAHRAAVVALLAREASAPPTAPEPVPPLPVLMRPGVPPDWCEGVVRLATMPVPSTISAPRWADFTATSARLLHDHGAELHATGWDALDLFGLHSTAPATNPPGWCLAWLLGAAGEVLDVGPDAVGMRRGPDGARLAFRRRVGQGGIVPAWELGCGPENRGAELP